MLEQLKEKYSQKLVTTDGYVLEAIQLLGLDSINTGWLANELEVPTGTLRDSIRRLRKAGLMNLPTANPRTGNTPYN